MEDTFVHDRNADQAAYWNGAAGRRWLDRQETLDLVLEPIHEVLLDRAAAAAGERAIDIGCGCGASTVELAQRVGRTGSVLGVDISAPMLARARERAPADLPLRFVLADATVHAFEPGLADLLFSRFGVMFFADPPAAFANLRRALAPKGRVGFVCWQGLDRNPWMRVPAMAEAAHVAFPAPPPPGTPGPFAFADPERVRGILERAGFHGIALEPHAQELTVGGAGADLDRAVEFMIQMGPTAVALRQNPDADLGRVKAAVREALAPYQTPRGLVMGSAAWLVTASA